MGWLRDLAERLFGGGGVPEGFPGRLDASEHVLAVASSRGGGQLVATPLGLWISEGDQARRVGWHLISKAVWRNDTLIVTEAGEAGAAGDAMLLVDRPPQRFALAEAGKLPDVVHARVTKSIASSHRHDLPDGGAWFVQRRVPGQDGVILQVRADAGTDLDVVRLIAAGVARRMKQARPQP